MRLDTLKPRVCGGKSDHLGIDLAVCAAHGSAASKSFYVHVLLLSGATDLSCPLLEYFPVHEILEFYSRN